ncbi:uncharacterized protein BDW47DRAFT_122805 [Aspergillus candidus]|uniref:Uncharacterized protein n=1 Tax=Aspergillus candidus TaxID=41067 RepID=A0A2I2FKU8_ASPCN|nr:hypothetical protein BDW47DRAFT_122805 [Aspergillus candidus]PLB41242.1 hypothetical protein BDW47DRAFT_122805 [Aspergillus candidus]
MHARSPRKNMRTTSPNLRSTRVTTLPSAVPAAGHTLAVAAVAEVAFGGVGGDGFEGDGDFDGASGAGMQPGQSREAIQWRSPRAAICCRGERDTVPLMAPGLAPGLPL